MNSIELPSNKTLAFQKVKFRFLRISKFSKFLNFSISLNLLIFSSEISKASKSSSGTIVSSAISSKATILYKPDSNTLI